MLPTYQLIFSWLGLTYSCSALVDRTHLETHRICKGVFSSQRYLEIWSVLFTIHTCVCVCVCVCVCLVTQSCPIPCDLWAVVSQAPLSMQFSRQDYWNGLPFPSPGDLPDLGIEPRSPTLQADALPSEPPGKPSCW